MKRNYQIVAASLGLAHLVLLSTAALAQDTTKTLNDVIVTASRSPKKQAEIGRVVTVISAKDISHAQGKTLPELLNTVPGITFSGAENAPGISSSLFTRGASTGNTLVLVDGFPVNNAGSINNSYDLNAFTLDQVDHIEILKGTGSTLYGSDAVAGVINIITKHPTKQGLTTNVQLAGGTYNTFTESAGINGRINNTGIAVNISNTDSRGFPAATDTMGKAGFKNDGFHQTSGSVNLSQQVSNTFTLNGNVQASYNRGDLPGGAFTDDKNYTYANKFLLAGIAGKLLLPKGALVVNLNQNNVVNGYTQLPTTENFSTYQSVKNVGRITNSEAVLNLGVAKFLDITSGASFKYSNTSQYSLYNTTGYTPPASVISPGSANNTITSAYTSLFIKTGIFHMEVGGRYNHHSKYGNNFTYTLNPSVLLFDRLKLLGTIASAFKAPTLYQLFSEYGNINLQPEKTISYEAGFELEIIKNALVFSTSFYKNNTDNVIYFYTQTVSPYSSFYKNGSFQKNKGYESELKYHADKITASAYIAYVTGGLTDANGLTTDNLYRRPKFTFGANAYYEFCKDFSAGLNYKFTGDRQDQNFNTYPATIVTLKRYNLVDAHLQYTVNRHINLFADVKNLFDIKYTDWLGYNTRGFNFMAGIRCIL